MYTAGEQKMLLEVLERFLELPATDLKQTLSGAADLLASALDADKIDTFLFDPSRNSLVAVGTSHQPLSDLQKRAGLDVLPVANGGRSVETFLSGKPHLSGHTRADYRLRVMFEAAEREHRTREANELRRSLDGTARLSALVSNLLDAARLEYGLMQLERLPGDMLPLLESIASTMSSPRTPVLFETTLRSAHAMIDEERVRECVENLVSNAQKHSPEAKHVVVRAKRDSRGDKHFVQVEIVDQGPGIPPDLLPHIFERFVSGSPTRGLGLGLFLAKRIAELHGGQLRVEFSSPKGTCFLLLLPLIQATE
jgi:signal transduction histidine kinase